MKIGIILQTRMRSKRLPGKVMKKILKKPMLWWIIERLKQIKNASELIIATTNNPKDRVIISFAKQKNISYFTGSGEDVLDRYYQTANIFHLDHIIRATADNPFIDSKEADRLVDFHLKTNADYSSNIDTLPEGVGVEIFTFKALEKAWKETKLPRHREHVNEYILENPEKFKISRRKTPAEKFAPDLRLTVDTLDDFKFALNIHKKLYKNVGPLFETTDIINFVKKTKNH